jgi:hypothetical protein
MNNELELIWAEVMALFKALSWHLPVGTAESHEKPVRKAGLQAEI